MSNFRGRGRGRGSGRGFSTQAQGENKVVTSAVVVMPPKELWGPIQEIRSKHDKAYARWMPHVNMAYPFVPESEFENARAKLINALSGFAPFTMTLNTFSFFKQGLGSTVHLNPVTNPPNALQDLQAILVKEFPHCNDLSQISADGFHPHLTVGQWLSQDATTKAIKNISNTWNPITITVSEIYLISRSAVSPFEIKFTIPLGSITQTSATDWSAPQTEEWEYTEKLEEIDHVPEKQVQSEEHILPLDDTDTSQPKTEMDQICEKIIDWYTTHKGKGHIPKTKYKLQNAVKTFCCVSQTVDVNKVMEVLKECNCIAVRGERIVYHKDKLGDLPSTNSSSYAQDKSALDIVVLKAKRWVLASADPPKNVKGFLSCLTQMCKIKIPYDPEKVVEYLQTKHLITIDYIDVVTYQF